MIKLIHGDDEFSSKEILNKFTGDKTKIESAINIIYSNSLSESGFNELVNTMSLFGENRKLIFIDLLTCWDPHEALASLFCTFATRKKQHIFSKHTASANITVFVQHPAVSVSSIVQ